MIQCQALEFQSTLSVRRATFVPMIPPTVTAQISIHALREESDPLKYIYPHLPYKFQSTLSVRRATGVTAFNFCLSLISIHALREESDRPLFISNSKRNISIHALREESDLSFLHQFCTVLRDFNPRSP